MHVTMPAFMLAAALAGALYSMRSALLLLFVGLFSLTWRS